MSRIVACFRVVIRRQRRPYDDDARLHGASAAASGAVAAGRAVLRLDDATERNGSGGPGCLSALPCLQPRQSHGQTSNIKLP